MLIQANLKTGAYKTITELRNINTLSARKPLSKENFGYEEHQIIDGCNEHWPLSGPIGSLLANKRPEFF